VALTFEFVLALTIVYGTNYLLSPLEKDGVPILGVEILAGMVFGSIFGVLTPATPGDRVHAREPSWAAPSALKYCPVQCW